MADSYFDELDYKLLYSGHGGGSTTSSSSSTTTSSTKNAKQGKIAMAVSDGQYAVYYQYAIAGVVGIFFIRNVILSACRFYSRQQKRKWVQEANEKGATRGVQLYQQKLWLERFSDRVDAFWMKPMWGDYTRIKVLMNLAIFSLTFVFCLVDGPLTVEKTTGFPTSLGISWRTGMCATALYPIIFLLAGRSGVVALFTGISYIELRYYHIVFGVYAFWLSLIHTVCYVANYYMNSTGESALEKALQQLYFQMGVVALVFLGTNWIFGLKWVRRRGYEMFLLSHIIGAALILAGSWYHRPSMKNYVYAASGIWVFERVCRWGMHLAHIAHARLFVRLPAHKGLLSVVDGAIKLNVPFKGKWAAGQHFYISFWGTELLRKPWLYGQVHPFSTTNVSVATESTKSQEIRFLLRIHGGLTLDLAKYIEKRLATKGGEEVDCLVTLEGPYGSAEPAEDFDSVLLVAGGSGITHPMSTFHDLTQRMAAGKAVTSAVKLVWAMHHADQAKWVVETLTESRAWAEQAKVTTEVDLYITRSDSKPSSGVSTPSLGSSTPSLGFDSPSLDEKKDGSLFSDSSDFAGGRTNRFYGRPDIQAEVVKAVEASQGRTLIVVCGPTAIAREVMQASAAYPRSQVVAEVATFEC